MTDLVEKELPRPTRNSMTFDLSGEIAEFTSFVVQRVVPGYASHYQEQIEREWKKVAGRFSDKAPTTQKLYVSKFRKAIEAAVVVAEPKIDRQEGILSRVKQIVKNAPGLIEQINEAYSAKVVENTRSLVFVESYQQIVAEARKMLGGKSDELRAVALMLLTGRRFYEVLVAGQFSPAVERYEDGRVRGNVMAKWSMDFFGQLKTREAEGTRFDELFDIPTLAPVKEVCEAIDRLRNSALGRNLSDATQEYVNSHYNRKFNKALRDSSIGELWPIEDTEFSLKSLRALYAEICFKHHAPSGIHKDTYFAKILGHRDGDLRTALSYVRYYLDEKDAEAARREMLRIAAEQEKAEQDYQIAREGETFSPDERVKKREGEHVAGRDEASPGDVSPDAIRDRLRLSGLDLAVFAGRIGRHRTTVWRSMVASGNPEIHQAIATALGVLRSDIWPSRYKVK